MANVKLHYYKNDVLQKTYIIEGFLSRNERKTQTSIDLPFPGATDEYSIINSIFGQKRIFSCGFIILDRTDDYTDGTGSPVTKAAIEQRIYLMDEIFKATGYHILEDNEGNTFGGRLEDLQILEAGDDPVKLDATFSFKRGIVPFAGNFSPI
jgi:hypothetical protein